MKFILKGPFKDNIYTLMRKVGYHFQRKDEVKSELIFVRPPSGYPRFHVYLKTDGSTGSPQGNENLIFNLHLDQKKPIYKGVTAHSGEYEGKVVETEIERIKQSLKNKIYA